MTITLILAGLVGLFVGTCFGLFLNYFMREAAIIMTAKWANREVEKLGRNLDKVGGSYASEFPSGRKTSGSIGLVMPGRTGDKPKLN